MNFSFISFPEQYFINTFLFILLSFFVLFIDSSPLFILPDIFGVVHCMEKPGLNPREDIPCTSTQAEQASNEVPAEPKQPSGVAEGDVFKDDVAAVRHHPSDQTTEAMVDPSAFDRVLK